MNRQVYAVEPIRKLATYVPVSQELIDDFAINWFPIWLRHELLCQVTMQMFGETWYRGRGELELIELGFAPKYDSMIWEDDE